MRLIVFKELEGRNFLSFGDTPSQICLRPGVNAIIGTNLDKEDCKNGAGKSSVTELLYYSLYGSTLREVSKDYIQNSLTKKRCETSLTFDIISNNTTDTYKIIRSLNPTKCVVLKNGADVTLSTLAKTNGFIQKLINTSSAVFQNSVIMAVNSTQPFMALSKTDKRKFIESVLGLEVFTEMVLKARDDYNTAKKDYEIKYSSLERIQAELSFNESQFKNYEKIQQTKLTNLQDKRTACGEDIDTLKSQLVEVSQQDLENLDKAEELLTSKIKEIKKLELGVNKEVVELNAEINSKTKYIQQLLENEVKCPTCARDFSEEHKDHVSNLIQQENNAIADYNVRKKTHQEKLQTYASEITNLEIKLKSCTDRQNDIKTTVSNNKSVEISIRHLEKNLKDIELDIVAVKNEQNNELKGRISSLNEILKNTKSEVDELNNKLNILESVKFIISEEGIKSFIVKKILTVLNSRIAFYLQKLEANCLCKFNEFFDEEIIDENSQPKSYFNFSGGERKRIDLACLFAFADIRRLQGDVNFSTVFYDELLDSSLDDKGVSLTLKVLRERFNENNESCYIITHRGPEVTTKAEHTIHVIKRNGISTISS
jgi:DNA repair exonuclease SbcCD ATPase subunit